MKKLMILLLAIVAVNVSVAQNGYKVGDQVADFKLKNVDGKSVSLADYKDAKGYIVIFTCNTCPYAKAYEDRIIDLHNKYAPLGYPVIAINPNDPDRAPGDSYSEMQKRYKEKAFPFVYLFDETQDVAMRFGASRTPHTYVLRKDSNGKMQVVYIGAIDDSAMNANDVDKEYLANALDQCLQGKDPQPNSTMAIGCTIKWRK